MANFKETKGRPPTFEGKASDYKNRNVDSLQNGVYRAAFPAFRVFIYGKEVTDDVTDVRVNQSGGSMERSTSTFSVSLINKDDRYILNHVDMLDIAATRGSVSKGIKENNTAFRTQIEERLASFGPAFGEGNTVDTYIEFLSRGKVKGDEPEATEAFIERLAAGGVDARDAEVQEAYANIYKFEGSVNPFIAREVAVNKQEIMTDKALNAIDGSAQILEALKQNDPAKLQQYTATELTILYKYPLSEGDCIFHPNDPVRIAYRDPFKPWIWYWMFTGFVDGYSEEMGVNQDSIVTVNGTDVLKTARYSYFQLDINATRDVAVKALFRDNPQLLGGGSDAEVAKFPIQFFENMFAGYSINEVLELMFFGQESFKVSVDQFTTEIIAEMSPEESSIYLMNYGHSGTTLNQFKQMSVDERNAKIKEHAASRKKKFDSANLPPLIAPNGTQFKRNNALYGVVSYFIGNKPASSLEKALGTNIKLKDLKGLNDAIHHRVNYSDLTTMAAEVHATNRGFREESSDIYSIISTIGKNIDDYPVGHGRVFAVIPGELSLGLASSALNENFKSATSDMHSQFKDRLTYLYDVADAMQFCLYATPRGDVVFEMPFYDFEPWNFTNTDTFKWNSEVESDKAFHLLQMSDNVDRWIAGSKDYNPDEIYKMMGLSRSLELAQDGFSVNMNDEDVCDYVREFTFTKSDTIDYSTALSDTGLKTIARGSPRPLARFPGMDNVHLYDYVFATIPGLSATLGFRMAADKTAWNSVTSPEAAQLSAAVELRKANADARNLGLQVLPRFGLMVNRPVYWRPRNYLANIVGCQHSISVNSSCQTTVNLSQIKAWSGSYRDKDNAKEYWDFFGGSQPFDIYKLLVQDQNAEKKARKVAEVAKMEDLSVETINLLDRDAPTSEAEAAAVSAKYKAESYASLEKNAKQAAVIAAKKADKAEKAEKIAAKKKARAQAKSDKQLEDQVKRPLTQEEIKARRFQDHLDDQGTGWEVYSDGSLDTEDLYYDPGSDNPLYTGK